MRAETLPPGLADPRSGRARVIARQGFVALLAFLTVVDLFATQAILPTLVKAYGVAPAAMGFAVNASTFGMALAGLGIAWFSRRIDRRKGILLSLGLLAVPTLLLATMPDLSTFALLRVAQGLYMCSAFTLTLAWLAETSPPEELAGYFAAYITGNVASNLVGRLVSAGVADHFGLVANFYTFAALNVAGALLAAFGIAAAPMPKGSDVPPLAAFKAHFANPPLRAAFGIGFCILFAFIGTFTYVNFVLARPPLAVGMMGIGFAYFVFLPSIVTTPLAGTLVGRVGARAAILGGLALAAVGLPLLLVPNLAGVLTGLTLVGVGTFFAQASATGFVGRAATLDRGSANGLYLASYFLGGLVGTAVLGQVFDRFGWGACVAGIGGSLALAALLALRVRLP